MNRHLKETTCPRSPQGLSLGQRAVLKGRMTTTHVNTQRHSGCLPTHTLLKTFFNAQVLLDNDPSTGSGDTLLPEPLAFIVKEHSFLQRLSPTGCLLPGTQKSYHHLQEDANSPAA
jgi:hypothetical protein